MSKVALVGGKGRSQNILKALELVGDDFIADFKRAQQPLIKVNFVSDTIPPAATHLDAVRAALSLLSPLTSQKITIAEASFGNTKKAFLNFGYLNLKEEFANVRLCDLNADETEEREGFRLAKTVLDSDFRIVIGPPKTHDTTIITAAMKNIVVGSIIVRGLLGRHWRGRFHQGSFREVNRRLVRLYQYVAPQLAVVDGFEVMEGAGPTGGDPVRTNWALAGTNAVEVDALAAYLLGFNPLDIGYLYFAEKAGLGEIEPFKIKVVGDSLTFHRRSIRPHPDYKKQLRWKVG